METVPSHKQVYCELNNNGNVPAFTLAFFR